MLNKEEIDVFIEMSYKIIYEGDLAKIEVLKFQWKKEISIFQKRIKQILRESKLKLIYCYLVNDKFFQIINNQVIYLLEKEKEALIFLKAKLDTEEKIENLIILMNIYENILEINLATAFYIESNINEGRTFVNNLPLLNVDNYLKINEEYMKLFKTR